MRILDDETIAQVRRDLEAGIAEMQAEIRRLEALLALHAEAKRLAARETDAGGIEDGGDA